MTMQFFKKHKLKIVLCFRSYYFSSELLGKIFVEAGFEIRSNVYIHRRTINKKEDLDVPRIFVQGKFQKPL
jgi:methyltransferase-like protein 6